MKEDVTDIILNLKRVQLKLHTAQPKTLRLEAAGEGEIRAGDIITDETVRDH